MHLHPPLTAIAMYFCVHNLQWQIQRGFHGFHGIPVFKGCLRKYYAQMFYLHYAYTGAMHFSFNSSNNTRVSSPVSRIRRAHGLHAHKYYQKHVETMETMSELKLMHALLPLQLAMVICNQYENAYFPMLYADNHLLCSLCGLKQSHAFNSASTTTRFSSMSSSFCNFTPRIHQKQSQRARHPKFSWGSMPPDPPGRPTRAILEPPSSIL